MRPQLTERSERKLYGRINPAERIKIIEENFDTFCEAGSRLLSNLLDGRTGERYNSPKGI